MFGGKGIYFEGVIVAIECAANSCSRPTEVAGRNIEAAGCQAMDLYRLAAWKTVAMPYWTFPTARSDDPDEMRALGAQGL